MGFDEQFVIKFYYNYVVDKYKFYKKLRFGKLFFIVCYYVIDVMYELDGFIEKNCDMVFDEYMVVLCVLINVFFGQVLDVVLVVWEKDFVQVSFNVVKLVVGRRIGVVVNCKFILGGIFKFLLIEFMIIINSIDVYYIRCIKFNEVKEVWKFEGFMVFSQFCVCGVFEIVCISCVGYFMRWMYEEFVLWYYMLVLLQ